MRVKIARAVLILLIYAGVSRAAQPFTILFFNYFHAHLEPFEVPGKEGEVGDGYAMFASLEPAYKTGLVLYDVVASGLREGRAVPEEPAGRIKFIGE